MAQIFISYRREDTGDFWADEIVEILSNEFGSLNVFKDTQSIRMVSNWQEVLKQKLKEAKIVVVLIGSHFFTLKGTSGQARIQEKNDIVRQEIREALQLGKTLVPVLLSQAKIPDKSFIPTDIQGLFNFQTFHISRINDIDRLIDLIASHLPGSSRIDMESLESICKMKGLEVADVICARATTETIARLAELGWHLWLGGKNLYLLHPQIWKHRFLVKPKQALIILQRDDEPWTSVAIFDVLPQKSQHQLLDLPEKLRIAASNPGKYLYKHGDTPQREIRKFLRARTKKFSRDYIEREWASNKSSGLKYQGLFSKQNEGDQFDLEEMINPTITAPKPQVEARKKRREINEAVILQEAAILSTDQYSWVAFHPFIPMLASSFNNNDIAIWNLENPEEEILPGRLPGHRHGWKGTVLCGKFAKDGRLATGAADGTIRIWDAKRKVLLQVFYSGGRLKRLVQRDKCEVDCVAWSPDNRILASVSRDKQIHLWDAYENTELAPIDILLPENGVLAFNPINGHLVTNGLNSHIGIIDLLNREWVLKIPYHAEHEIAISPDGSMLATGGRNGEIVLFDMLSGKTIGILEGHNTSSNQFGSNQVSCVQFSPDGRWLASLSGDPFMIVWDVMAQKPAAIYEHDRQYNFMRCIPQLTWFWDSQWLAFPILGGEIRILKLEAKDHKIGHMT